MVKMPKLLKGKTFIDLFAGIGGFHLALESLGAKCVYASEIDKTARKIYEKNFVMKPDGDITKISAKDIPNHHILCAGFPCQAFSISGKKKGFKDSRGIMFFEIARIVNIKRPEVIFLENVRTFATHEQGHTMQVVRDVLEGLGYTVYANVLNASDYGIPQKRERKYIVCFKKNVSFEFPKPFSLETHVEDYLLDDELVQQLYVDREITWNGTEGKYANKPIRLGSVEKDDKANEYTVSKELPLHCLLSAGVYLQRPLDTKLGTKQEGFIPVNVQG